MLPTSDHDFSVVRASTGCKVKRTNGTASSAPTAALPAASRPARKERRLGGTGCLSGPELILIVSSLIHANKKLPGVFDRPLTGRRMGASAFCLSKSTRTILRSEERRVGKECKCWWLTYM